METNGVKPWNIRAEGVLRSLINPGWVGKVDIKPKTAVDGEKQGLSTLSTIWWVEPQRAVLKGFL